MARNEKLSSNYARAILAFAGSPDKGLAIAGELSAFSKVVEGHKELKTVLQTAVFSEAQRRGVLEELAKFLKWTEASKRILFLLSENDRLLYLGAIAERLRLLALQATDIVPVAVAAPQVLAEKDRLKIEAQMQKVLGKKVDASYALDPHLLGGLRVSAAGKTYDGTLAGWLAAVEDKLVGGL